MSADIPTYVRIIHSQTAGLYLLQEVRNGDEDTGVVSRQSSGAMINALRNRWAGLPVVCDEETAGYLGGLGLRARMIVRIGTVNKATAPTFALDPIWTDEEEAL